MDEKSKGISLRKNRSGKPKISAPISGPLPAGFAAGQSSQPLPSIDGPGLPSGPRPRERPQNGDRTADLVKRRYSTRFALAQDFGDGSQQLPIVPSIPDQFAVQPPSRDGNQGSGGQRVKVDVKALRDPSLQPEQCKFLTRSPHHQASLTCSFQMSQTFLQMPPRKTSNAFSRTSAKSKTAHRPTYSRMSFRTGHNLSKSVKKQRNSRPRCELYVISCLS